MALNGAEVQASSGKIHDLSLDYGSYQAALPLVTKFYIVQKNQTIEQLIRSYCMKLDLFRYLNPFYQTMPIRTELVEGTLLIMPLIPLSLEGTQKIKAPLKLSKQSLLNSNVKQNVEQYVVQHVLKDKDLSKNNSKTETLIKNNTLLTLSDKLTNWFDYYGQASILLNMDRQGSLAGSQFDLLFPLYYKGNQEFFIQNTYHNFDNRLGNNLAMGFRYFYKDFMLGVNGAMQYDLSQNHMRSALGVEYARDFMRFAINYYQPLTTGEFVEKNLNYGLQAIPAEGYSLEAEAYLPVWPEFGIHYRFERYNNADTDINADGILAKNPQKSSVGISYTPVSLIQLRLNYNLAEGKKFLEGGIALAYDLGTPFKQQMCSSEIVKLRKLLGQKKAFILSNPDMILAYKKT